MSQEQLADQAGISLTTVTRLERQPRAARRSRILGRLAPEIGEDPSTLALARLT
jgi:transcriptional regulator with XRE-family HTH domain